MAGELTKATVDAMLELLRNFPADGKFRTDEQREVGLNCVLFGFVSNEEQTKPCRECGTPRVDFRYYKITPAGRAFLLYAGQ